MTRKNQVQYTLTFRWPVDIGAEEELCSRKTVSLEWRQQEGLILFSVISIIKQMGIYTVQFHMETVTESGLEQLKESRLPVSECAMRTPMLHFLPRRARSWKCRRQQAPLMNLNDSFIKIVPSLLAGENCAQGSTVLYSSWTHKGSEEEYMVHKSKTNEKISSFPRQYVETFGGKTQRVTKVLCFLLVWSVFLPRLLLNIATCTFVKAYKHT